MLHETATVPARYTLANGARAILTRNADQYLRLMMYVHTNMSKHKDAVGPERGMFREKCIMVRVTFGVEAIAVIIVVIIIVLLRNNLPLIFFFFLNDTATPEFSPFPLHAPLPIFRPATRLEQTPLDQIQGIPRPAPIRPPGYVSGGGSPPSRPRSAADVLYGAG